MALFQRINIYVADKIGAFLILIGQRANVIHWIGIYPLDKVIHSSYNRAQINRISDKGDETDKSDIEV